jgi:hypothetical protein
LGSAIASLQPIYYNISFNEAIIVSDVLAMKIYENLSKLAQVIFKKLPTLVS